MTFLLWKNDFYHVFVWQYEQALLYYIRHIINKAGTPSKSFIFYEAGIYSEFHRFMQKDGFHIVGFLTIMVWVAWLLWVNFAAHILTYLMTAIIIFFFAHWFLSLFFHTFFLHRYASHQMYTTNKTWEKIFYFLTWFTQGSSFLVPRAYAVMHRMHHVYSDTEKDPHSPHFFKDVWQMMLHTAKIYQAFLDGTMLPDKQFTKDYLPVWPALDKIGYSNITRVLFAAAYTTFYLVFAPSYWWLLLLPIHFLMGPVQGAIVNWFGHKLGYSNFNNGDHSKNTSPFGILLMGELFQNNHHYAGESPNFAQKWYEFDPTYQVMKVFNFIGIIKLKPKAAIVQHSSYSTEEQQQDDKALRA